MTGGRVTLRQAILSTDPDAVEVAGTESLLLGIAAWAAATSTGRGAVLVGGVEQPQGTARVPDAASDEQFVLAATGVATLAAVIGPRRERGIDAPGGTLVCSGMPHAIAAGLEVLALRGGDAIGAAEHESMQAALHGAEVTPVLPLLAGLESAIRADRSSIAAWVHDRLAQELTAAQLQIDTATWGAELPAAVDASLTEGLSSLRAAIGGCRRLMAWLTVVPGRPVEDP
jgi:signal transduction histidine kinase